MYSWGKSNHGQTGINTPYQNTPRQVDSVLGEKKVIGIFCGQTSTIVVTKNGEVYGFGNNSVGQLGTNNYDTTPTIRQVDSLKGTVIGNSRLDKAKRDCWIIDIILAKVACGYEHTLALSDEGKLYAWGGNSYGQLGIGNKTNSCTPVMVNSCLLSSYQ